MREFWRFRRRRLPRPPRENRSVSAYVLDRGPAKYFHGRSQILIDFHRFCNLAVEEGSGTTFLVQGPPGAGKTALLSECSKRARAEGWQVVDMTVKSLHDPAAFMEDLGRAYISSRVRSKKFDLSKYLSWSSEVRSPGSSVFALIRSVSSRAKLLLILDEVQNIASDRQAVAPFRAEVEHTLDLVHNGRIGNTVMLLAGGLGTSRNAFQSLGISRFGVDCVVELGGLSRKAERAVLWDWMTKEGEATGDPTEWIDAITQRTYGWPQHIMSYVKPALDQLDIDKTIMSPSGLEAVLANGLARRTAYYQRRVSDIGRTPLIIIARVLNSRSASAGVLKEEILIPLTSHYDKDEAERLFFVTLQKGVLEENDDRFRVPILSMYNWLMSKYAHLELPEQA